MEVQVRQGPAYAVARLSLAPNEPVKVEAGAMMAMSPGVSLESKAEGGMLKSLKRAALGGESFFVSTYTAPQQGGFVDVAARLAGDAAVYEVPAGRALFVQKGSWLANEATVSIDAQWGGFKNMFGSEGGFIVRVGGTGKVVFGAYGAIEVWNLEAGQSLTVDTGHMVAYEDSVQMSIRKATGGVVQMFKSGEGLVFDFAGPGRVWTQTRNPNELLGWISAALGTSNSGTAGGVAGLFGRDLTLSALLAASGTDTKFADISVPLWGWAALLAFIALLLIIDLVVFHKEAHDVSTKEAAIESAVWISIGLAFTLVVWWAFGSTAGSEYISGYLIEKSLSVDNVFVWALIFTYFKVPGKYQHRVLFWGIFGALVLRAIFIFAGVALIQKFDWILYVFGAFLLYTAVKMVLQSDEEIDPSDSIFLRLIRKVVPVSDELDGQKLFTRVNAKRVATPLFAVLMLVEATDVVFAVDSVPAVLAVSREQFIVFSSNAFAILGLRALYFLLADMHARFSYLQQGLAVILAFVGIKMILAEAIDYHIPTPISLLVIALVLGVSVLMSLQTKPHVDTIELVEGPVEAAPPPDER